MKTGISLLLLILSGFGTEILAQVKPEKAPLNPFFKQYIEENGGAISKKSAGEKGLGYVPGPLNLHFNPVIESETEKKATQALPASYDLRTKGWVTTVKDQGPAGACWSFSTMGAIESRWARLGFGKLDLSEQNLATCHGFNAGINDGGSDFIAAAYLTRLSGPVTEESHPYNPKPTAKCVSTGLVKTAYAPTVVWLPKDVNTIKKAVYNYGGVTASIYTGGASMNAYYNFMGDYTFYYGGTAPPDHGVLVVGWDDNKMVYGGLESPGVTQGAWIVKNSWGTSWGNSGYFYVSYQDTRFLSSASLFPERVELSDIDTLYMHDLLGSTTSYGFRQETSYGLVKFTAPSQHFINKVGTFLNASGSTVDIEIYDDFQGDSLLTNLIATSYGNIEKFPGYYTFNIPALVEGDFYVKIKYTTPGYTFPVPAEAKISYQGITYANPVIEAPGINWVSKDGVSWKAMGSGIEYYDADLSIRVYAERSVNINPYFTADRVVSCVGTPITYTSASNGNITSYSWNFGSGASPATASSAGPHSVAYSTPGNKTVRLTIEGPSGSRTLTKKEYVQVVNELDVFLPYSEKTVIEGKSFTMTAFGADEYTWSPSTYLDKTTGSSVVSTPLQSITYTINGTLGTCSGSTSILLNVVKNPDNDEVCNAIHLTKSGWTGSYNNINATVDDGEPAPPEGDCNTPLEWCIEGGLQNSVWFSFIGPHTGVVSIDSEGMDNQIAVYKAIHCDSILTGAFEMVAANDDYHPENKFYAAAIENISVVPGDLYFIQVDGSAGGAEGYFYLYVFEYPLGDGNNDKIKAPDLMVYPNPGNGVFKISLNAEDPEILDIRVIDITGRTIYRNSIMNLPGLEHHIDLSNQKAGSYILEVRSERSYYRKNILIQ